MLDKASWPPLLGHLPTALPPLHRDICERAMRDLFICETPPSSNRSGRIDKYNTAAGAPLGSYWCASWDTAVWADAGADLPPTARASNDVLVWWAMENNLWIAKADAQAVLPGDLVMYTSGKLLPPDVKLPNGKLPHPKQLDAVHTGLVMRTDPYFCSAEGNAPWGGAFGRNGEAVLARRVDMDRVYGFIKPRPTAAR
jgi:hypothetical protein